MAIKVDEEITPDTIQTFGKVGQGEDGTRVSDRATVEKADGKTATEIYRKLNWLPMGSMIGMQQVMHLEENEQDQVLI